jgi:hypothetical protein
MYRLLSPGSQTEGALLSEGSPFFPAARDNRSAAIDGALIWNSGQGLRPIPYFEQ